MNEWNIQSRAHACEVCAQPFADKQPFRTILFEAGKELLRSDICEPCAEKAGDARSRSGYISHWNGTYEAPPAHPAASPLPPSTRLPPSSAKPTSTSTDGSVNGK